MSTSGDRDLPSWDAEGSGDAEEDPADELQAAIGQADHAFGAESFGTTDEEEEEGESLDQRLAQERPDRANEDFQLGLEDTPDDEEELVGEATPQRDAFVSPEESAMSIRTRAPGAVDHPPEPGTSGDD